MVGGTWKKKFSSIHLLVLLILTLKVRVKDWLIIPHKLITMNTYLVRSTAAVAILRKSNEKEGFISALGSISQRVMTSPNLGLVLGDIRHVWLMSNSS